MLLDLLNPYSGLTNAISGFLGGGSSGSGGFDLTPGFDLSQILKILAALTILYIVVKEV